MEVLGGGEVGAIDGEDVAVDENAEVGGDGEAFRLGEGLEALFEGLGDDDLNGGDGHNPDVIDNQYKSLTGIKSSAGAASRGS